MHDLILDSAKKTKECPSRLMAGKLLHHSLRAKKAKRGGGIWDSHKSVQACLSGDQVAFGQIVEHYRAYVFDIIRVFADDSDVSEASREVFLQMYRSFPQCDPGDFTVWISKIAAGQAINWKKSQRPINSVLSDIDIKTCSRSSALAEVVVGKKNCQEVR